MGALKQVLVRIQEKQFFLDMAEDFTFSVVLTSIVRHSTQYSYGATRDDLYRDANCQRWDYIAPILDELKDAGLITAKEHQIGTCNIRDMHYKLADGCSAKIVISVSDASGDKKE